MENEKASLRWSGKWKWKPINGNGNVSVESRTLASQSMSAHPLPWLHLHLSISRMMPLTAHYTAFQSRSEPAQGNGTALPASNDGPHAVFYMGINLLLREKIMPRCFGALCSWLHVPREPLVPLQGFSQGQFSNNSFGSWDSPGDSMGLCFCFSFLVLCE